MLWLPASLAVHLPAITTIAASTGDPCTLQKTSFFIIPPWWEYLQGQVDPLGVCSPAFHMPGDLWAVGLALVDMLLRLAGFAAVVSIIIAGVQYVTSIGNADKITAARKRITNALIGVAVVSVATAFVTFLGKFIAG